MQFNLSFKSMFIPLSFKLTMQLGYSYSCLVKLKCCGHAILVKFWNLWKVVSPSKPVGKYTHTCTMHSHYSIGLAQVLSSDFSTSWKYWSLYWWGTSLNSTTVEFDPRTNGAYGSCLVDYAVMFLWPQKRAKSWHMNRKLNWSLMLCSMQVSITS